jgi:hypothetical protein
LDIGFAVQSARDAAQRAENLRIRIEETEHRLRVHPGDPNIRQKLDELKAEADRCDEIVATWDAKITQYRATQEHGQA